MTIQDKINDLQKQIDALKTKAAKQDGVWPKNGDNYFTINNAGEINESDWDNFGFENELKQRCLIFRTEEEAERYDKQRILIAAIREFAGHYKPVWDGETRNHTITYLHNEKLWVVNGWSNNDHLPICGYFKDKETAQACIEKFKDELHILREV